MVYNFNPFISNDHNSGRLSMNMEAYQHNRDLSGEQLCIHFILFETALNNIYGSFTPTLNNIGVENQI